MEKLSLDKIETSKRFYKVLVFQDVGALGADNDFSTQVIETISQTSLKELTRAIESET
jgi:hypothetical protein